VNGAGRSWKQELGEVDLRDRAAAVICLRASFTFGVPNDAVHGGVWVPWRFGRKIMRNRCAMR